jgi:uncharacterized protein YcbX
MRGESLDSADMGWHGIEGDRRFALRRVGAQGGMPWLTASKLPDLILFSPQRHGEPGAEAGVTHVRTPANEDLPVFSEALASEVSHRLGAPVEMMQLDRGTFDEAPISVIASGTVREIARLSGTIPDQRRFRPNIVLSLRQPGAFREDDWVGADLIFGEGSNGPAVSVMMRDVRCSIINLDPDSAKSEPTLLKAVARENGNDAGVYCTVTRCGTVTVGQKVFLKEKGV